MMRILAESFSALQVSFAMNQIATEAATAGPRGKGRKRTRSAATENGAGKLFSVL